MDGWRGKKRAREAAAPPAPLRAPKCFARVRRGVPPPGSAPSANPPAVTPPSSPDAELAAFADAMAKKERRAKLIAPVAAKPAAAKPAPATKPASPVAAAATSEEGDEDELECDEPPLPRSPSPLFDSEPEAVTCPGCGRQWDGHAQCVCD